MQLSFKVLLLAPILLLTKPNTSQAQQNDEKDYPSALLVQLRSEHNRIEALKKANKYKELEEVMNDGAEVRKRMILDFHNNFEYCPVYYYMDTNAEFVKEKKFAGILLNEDGSPVKDPVINSASDDYVIAYYGYPISQSRQTKVQTDTSRRSYDPDPPFGKGLVILNDKYLQLTYFYKFGYDELAFDRRKNWLKKYYYNSKHFDIEYYPLAYLFNRTMLNRYGPRHIYVTKKEFK